jgi:hypothetical protein
MEDEVSEMLMSKSAFPSIYQTILQNAGYFIVHPLPQLPANAVS